MFRGVLELHVARPPMFDAAAIAFVKEQHADRPDIVWQGIETVRALAGVLKGGRIWHFCWN